MLTLQLWHALQNPNSQTPLYYQLRHTYKDYRGWASNEFDFITFIIVLLNVAAAPLFGLMPLLTIFVFGAYWCGYVAGQIQHEHTTDRYDLLALLPDGSMAVSWVLSALHIRNSGIYQYIHDGLRITMLIGGMILFVLVSGVIIGIVDERTPLEEGVFPLLNMTLALACLLLTLYGQQIQAVILSQLLGMAIPTLVDEVMKTRVWAIGVFLTMQVLIYASVLTVALAIMPLVLRDNPFAIFIQMLTITVLLITTHEIMITLLWRHLNQQLGSADMERLLV